ncbi:MAG: tRNA 2-thiocytidine biosynthesis protein TtcA [Clostridiales bacterium]|jgi:tRNA(Ile)-lysidine synthase TilS/MesJ|nr:tRNA 2-thiocytidine biosynthesis protein TtcA [Clostridiales bacterium]
MEGYERIERSIITTYRASVWKKFVEAVNEYKLINDGDKIAVCISGGKDSMLMAKCFQELKKHGKNNFEALYMVMDPGYNEYNRRVIEENLKTLNIPAEIFETNIFDTVAGLSGAPCYLCARMRRGNLYAKAKELGCNKIALGHHFNDVIETVLMGIFYNGRIQSMPPKLKSKNFEGMELIRPMYKIEERDIINFKNYNKLEFIRCACRFTEFCSPTDDGSSTRRQMKNLVKTLKKTNVNADINIFKSMYNINLDTVIGYQKDGVRHNLIDEM